MSTPPPVTPAIAQYNAYLVDLGNIGSRYATANGFYLCVVAAVLGILSLMKPGEGLSDLQTILRLTVPVFGVGLCFVWRQTVVFYSALFATKFDVLREMEASASLFPTYTRELALFKGPRWLLNNEARIPLFLSLPFVVVFLHTLWSLACRTA